MDEFMTVVREWGWLSGPAMAGAWAATDLIRRLLRRTPEPALTEPVRSMVASLLDPADSSWSLLRGSPSMIQCGNLIVDSRDAELLECVKPGEAMKMGYPPDVEKDRLKAAALARLVRLQREAQIAVLARAQQLRKS